MLKCHRWMGKYGFKNWLVKFVNFLRTVKQYVTNSHSMPQTIAYWYWYLLIARMLVLLLCKRLL